MLDISYLRQRQSNPLDVKIEMSKIRIREWYEKWGGLVYISYSGGKDSDVLLHLVRSVYPDAVAVLLNTRVEYPEVIRHARGVENLEIIRPEMRFSEVITRYGYPVVSKEQSYYILQCRTTASDKLRDLRLYGREGKSYQGKISDKWKYLLNAPFKISDKCCDVLKKRPFDKYTKETGRYPYLGTKAADSSMRQMDYLSHGCNAVSSRPASRPLSFWLEADMWEYIKRYGLEICELYYRGFRSTGCMYCCFGLHREKCPNRLQLLAKLHPRLWQYGIEDLGLGAVLDYMGIDYRPGYEQLELLL